MLRDNLLLLCGIREELDSLYDMRREIMAAAALPSSPRLYGAPRAKRKSDLSDPFARCAAIDRKIVYVTDRYFAVYGRCLDDLESAQLDPDIILLIRYRCFLGLKYTEIARRMGCTYRNIMRIKEKAGTVLSSL